MGDLGIAEEDWWRMKTAQGRWRSDEGMMISRKNGAMTAGQSHKARSRGTAGRRNEKKSLMRGWKRWNKVEVKITVETQRVTWKSQQEIKGE